LSVIEQISAGGASLRQIAAELNARGIKTARGGKWHATTVRNILMAKNGVKARGDSESRKRTRGKHRFQLPR